MEMIQKLIKRDEFKEQPPVLLDIGAATHLHKKWKKIAKYSICIAFDPDSRSMEYISEENGRFKKLCIVPAIVHAEIDGETEFYLTTSPECSSLLEPLNNDLSPWMFADFYGIDEKKILPSVTLLTTLKKFKIDYIDWFKIDSQGTDLRIFKSLGNDIIDKVLAAELEPGIMNTYRNEDKVYSVLDFMDQRDFIITEFKIFGSQYLPRPSRENDFSKYERKALPTIMKTAPGWTEITFLNKMNNNKFSQRDYILGFILALIEEQYGLALELAEKGREKFSDAIFKEMRAHALKRLKNKCYFSWSLYRKIIKKLIRI